MIGTARSRVSLFMNKFRKLSWIDYNGTIHVRQSLLKAVRQDKPEMGSNASRADWTPAQRDGWLPSGPPRLSTLNG
jgi:CRP/FNR family transcriptional regulator, cyclic AMP receptor protein